MACVAPLGKVFPAAAEHRAYGHDALYAALACHLRHVCAERFGGHARLLYIAQDEHAGQSFALGTAAHEVERYVQTAQVTVVGVVDERAPVAPALHFQTHGHRLQPCHAFADDLLAHAQVAAHGTAYLLVVLHGTLAGAVPGDELAAEAHLLHALAHYRVIGWVYEGLRVAEQLQLLCALLLHALEVLLMCRPQACENADGGLYDSLEGLHLARLGDGRFEYAYLALCPESPHRERYAYLRIVAARAARHGVVVHEQLIEPLLDGGLAIASRYADDGDVECLAVAFGKPLQSLAGVGHQQKVCLGQLLLQAVVNHKVAHAAPIQFVDKPMPVAS